MRSRNSSLITVHTSLLFDPKQKDFIKDISIGIDPDTGLVDHVYHRKHEPGPVRAPDVDLRGKIVLPGLVDAHTHVFLHSYAETPALYQMRDESLVERVIRATNHCRTALLAGYTTYRDLGTEGLRDADVNIRDAINRGIAPGPRLYVATETIASSSGYAIRQENSFDGTPLPRIADIADGVDDVRAAVRRRIGAGADIVKFYADYRKRRLRFPEQNWPGALPIQFPPKEQNPNVVLFTQDEMDAMVDEAKRSGAPIAAHAACPQAVIMAAKAGVTTIEHGYEPSEEALRAMVEAGTIFVPTLSVCETALPMKPILEHVKKGWDIGIKFAAGGDTGAFAHGDNVREIELMVEAGIPLNDVLVAATLHGWEACGAEKCGRKFGIIEEGAAADMIALDEDPRDDTSALRRVSFVMKDGKIWKHNGSAVGMF